MALVVLTEHVCPMCHSKNINRVHSGDVLERLVLRFRRKRSYRCRDCDHRFYDRPASKQSSPARAGSHTRTKAQ